MYICYPLEINQKEMIRQLTIRQLRKRDAGEREGNVHFSVVSNRTKENNSDEYLNTLVCNYTLNTWNC